MVLGRARSHDSATRSSVIGSQIAIRMLVDWRAMRRTKACWRQRLAGGLRFRESLHIDATAYRVVHGEADLLPSLVVDRYGDYLVVQTLSQGMDRLLPELTQCSSSCSRRRAFSPATIRRSARSRDSSRRVDVLHGDIPDSVQVREGGVEYDVDLRHGQKTGLFLDQRENRDAAARYARGRLLDCFSYNGGFALSLARNAARGRRRSTSPPMRSRAFTQNAARNGVPQRQAREANVFDELRHFERSGARFDTIVLDPPAFAKNKASIDEGDRRLQGHQPARDADSGARRRARHLQLLVQRGRGRCSCRCSRTRRPTATRM